ncbi:universal stress protein [Hymenobacter sp. BT188]|uniref:universal stress protein n=1 Tax=Hymenobacter sp. BT188 TaxID=2763504 RepID=UPI0016515ECF|nr:universal stress protein [Hymenobacter sp. BT188]MBC6605880.1 universal stress protein [Hymenobacter sp. BT188]
MHTLPEATAPDSTTITFIVLTSFFPEGRRAVQFAAELAAPLGARLVLLHSNHRGLLRKTSKALAEQQSTVYLEQALQEMAAGLGSPTTIELATDLFPTVINDLAQRYHPALFVLGRPHAERADFDLGAATLDVLRNVELPLLLVPQSYTGPAAPQHVAIAADAEAFALPPHALAPHILHKLRPPRTTVITVAAMQNDMACASALHYVGNSGLLPTDGPRLSVEGYYAIHPDLGILEALASTNADCLILLARRRSVLGGFFHRSITNQLLMRSPVPVLVVPAIDG